VIVALSVYYWLLCLYPGNYRHEFGEEMTSVFRDARSALPPALAARIRFYRREFCGLLSGALCAHLDRLFGPSTPLRRFSVQPQFRFPRSTVFLMCVILAGLVLAIHKAQNVVQMRESLSPATATAWGPMLWGLLFALALILAAVAAAAAWGVLFALRRTGMHRLDGMQTSAEHHWRGPTKPGNSCFDRK
jgi:hypothetical protein